jgi:hypothetical protein
VQEAAAAKADRPVVAGLKQLGCDEAKPEQQRKGDRGKVALARELRAGTRMPLSRIAGRLNTGSRGYPAWRLSRRNPSVRIKSK